MRTLEFVKRTHFALPAEDVFAWHLRPGALERLTPAWDAVEIVERSGSAADGGRVTLRLRIGPVPVTWVAAHTDFVPGRMFRDEMVRGPMARWQHTHTVEPGPAGDCVLEDRIAYALRGGALGRWLGGGLVARKLQRLFAYRHEVTKCDVELLRKLGRISSMKILLAGSHGFIGSALVPMLTTAGHHVSRLVRAGRPTGIDQATRVWNPREEHIDPTIVDGFDAVINLAGESIVGRWTPAKKERLRTSRVDVTRKLALALAQAKQKPKVFLSASAIGYYASQGDLELTETSSPGEGFLAQLAKAWEEAAAPAREAGVRVVHARIGVVLGAGGGALAKMLPLYQLGLGGPLGGGQQWWSWIALDDALGAMLHCLVREDVTGAVNFTAPTPVRQADFSRTLGKVLGRPAFLPTPGWGLKLMLGEMAETMLVSQRVLPWKLTRSGYTFRYPTLEPALRHLLGRNGG